jgi:predicted transcriptional regulator
LTARWLPCLHMAQLTVRVPDDLADKVKQAARARGRSMNEHVLDLLRAATDPDLATDEAARLRERFAQAGILTPPGPARGARPDPGAVAAARRRAASGTPLPEIVATDR